MSRSEFEAEVRQQGYDVRDGEIPPDQHRPAHSHPFDARLFVLDGHLTLVFGERRETFAPGMSCNVPAGTVHEELTGPDGVRYVAARRSAQPASAAE